MRHDSQIMSSASVIKSHSIVFLALLIIVNAGAEIFQAGRYVPISEYGRLGANTEINYRFKRPEIVRYIGAHHKHIGIAYRLKGSDSINYSLDFTISPDSTTLSFNTFHEMDSADYVIVTDAFLHDMPLVTHWDSSLNGGRGGFRLGASDHITNVFDENPSSDKFFNVAQYSLFTDDPEAQFPDYERYVGEKYSCAMFGDLDMLRSCNDILLATGYPVVVYCEGKSVPIILTENAPFFQMHYASVIECEPNKSMLATALYPPYWKRNPAKRYPIVCYSMYDISQSFWIATEMAPVLSALVDSTGGHSAIGVIFNGGGTWACYSTQRSFYDNVAIAFRLLYDEANGDTSAIVAYGISRGATSAIRIAANPYNANYRIREAIVQSYGGESPVDGFFIDAKVYPNTQGVWENIIGFKINPTVEWTHPSWGQFYDGKNTIMRILFGIDQNGNSDTTCQLGNPFMLSSLKNKGTRITIQNGTNDVFISSCQWIQWVNRARAEGIPVTVELAYRNGHQVVSSEIGTFEYLKDYLQSVINGTPGPAVVTERRFRSIPQTSDGSWHPGFKYEEIHPEHEPFYLEASRWNVKNDSSVVCIVGEPGASVRLSIGKLDEEKFQTGIFEEIGEEILLKETVIGASSTCGYSAFTWIPDTLDTGTYVYHLRYRLSGETEWVEVDNSKLSREPTGPGMVDFDHSIRKCLVGIASEYPPGVPFSSLYYYFNPYVDDALGWGMSEE